MRILNCVYLIAVFVSISCESQVEEEMDMQQNLRNIAMGMVPSFDDQETSFKETIEKVILQIRNQSAIQIPGVEIPDPMFIPDFNTTVKEGGTNADVQLWNVSISGISAVVLNEVGANLGDMDITIGLNISELITRGQYKLKGKYYVVRLSGNGDFWMKVKDVHVTGNLFLGVNEEGILHVTDINLDVLVGTITLHFQNLFGGGVMSSFSNAILNAVSPIIFSSVKPTLLDQMQTIMINLLNEQFQQFPPQPTLAKSQVPLDLAIANSATQIREKGLDPFPLPSQQMNFNRRLLFIRLYGNLTLHKGYMRGLSSIHRTGEIILSYKDNYGNATAQVGFSNLEGGYNWNANFMGISRKGGAHFVVKQINTLITFTQANEKHSHPIVNQLKITNIDEMSLDMDGLGSFDYLLEFFTNFFTNAFKRQFSRILAVQVRDVLQENLKDFKIPF